MSTDAPERTETAPQFLEFVGLKVADDEKREVTGLALPYGEELERMDWWTGATHQVFEQGSAIVRDNAQLYFGHDHMSDGLPIGRITAHEHTERGLEITARISKTAKGDEVYTLLKDGVLDRFSIGFYKKHNELSDAGSDKPVLKHTEIDVFEVSVVPDPAFKSAVIEQVLSHQQNPTAPEGNTMPESATLEALPAQFEALSASLDTLERQLATLGQQANTPDPVPFASYGESIKTLASGDELAIKFFETLAYGGGTIGDLDGWVKDSWVGDIIRYVEERRLVLNLFGTSPLPPEGMKIEYGKLVADTTQVAKQLAEGDLLPFGKVTFDTDFADVETRGGWGEMSRQQIERSSMNVVEKFFFYLLRTYAQYTEAQVRAVAQAATGAHAVAATDLTTSDGWIDFMVESAVWLDDKGLVPDFVLVGKDVFKDLAKLRDGAATDAPRLLDRNSGSMSVVGLTGDVFSVPVKLVGSFAADTVRVCSKEAIETFEAPGAPFRLQDEDITNLTKAFSVYGYGAVAPQEPDAIVVPGA